MSQRSCFFSYPWTNRQSEDLAQDVVRPVLQKLGWLLLDPCQFVSGDDIFETISRQLKGCSLFMADLSQSNSNVLYELGMAHGWGKRSILFTQRLEHLPFDVASRYAVIPYSSRLSDTRLIRERLVTAIEDVERSSHSLIDPSLERLISAERMIAIELVGEQPGVRQLSYAADVLNALSALAPIGEGEIRELRLGSLGTFVESEIKSIVSLVEKLVFFLPEWRQRNAQKVRIEAEAELFRAQAERERAEAHAISRRADREDRELVLKALDTIRSLSPSRVTLGDQIVIDTSSEDYTVVSVPPRRRRRKE